MNSKHDKASAHFQEIHLKEENSWSSIQWVGDIEGCDVCSRPMEDERYMIDGPAEKTAIFPRWGNMCVVCAFKYAPVIGWGKAQLYHKESSSWQLVAGGDPATSRKLRKVKAAP